MFHQQEIPALAGITVGVGLFVCNQEWGCLSATTGVGLFVCNHKERLQRLERQ
ncbi:MAG: hypothetical protein ACR5LF_05160 [Symbiopectobacterium sp.]